MKNITSTINALPDLLFLKPASAAEISNSEKQLDLRFADEYREYVSKFGAISANDIELTGIVSSERLNVVSVTKQKWAINLKVPHDLYVIEVAGIDGIIIWQNRDGEIFQTTPNSEPVRIADSLETYLEKK